MKNKVILVSIDGMRPDGVMQCGNPFVEELMKKGAYTLEKFADPSDPYGQMVNTALSMEGAFDFALMKQGVREHAFHSIFAGGKRATTLHYGENNQIVHDGEMVLIDDHQLAVELPSFIKVRRIEKEKSTKKITVR